VATDNALGSPRDSSRRRWRHLPAPELQGVPQPPACRTRMIDL